MAEFNKAQRFFAALDPGGVGAFVRDADRIAAQERANERRAASASEARKNKIKLEFTREAIAEAESRGMDRMTFLESNPWAAGVLESNGIPLDVQMPAAQPDVELTDLEEGFAAEDRLRKAAIEAEAAGDTARANVLMDRLAILEEENRPTAEVDRDIRDLGDRVGVFEDGVLVRTEPKGRMPGSGGGSSQKMFTVSRMEADENGQMVRVPLGNFPASKLSQFEGDPNIRINTIGTGRATSERMVVGKDGEVTITRNTGSGDNTVAETSRLLKDERSLEKNILRGLGLLNGPNALREEDVGVRGVFNETVSATLGQVLPFVNDPDVTQRRTAMTAFREATLRNMTTDSRFSNIDRAKIEAMFPSDGAFESLPRARAKVMTVVQVLQDHVRLAANRLGRKPLDAMTPREIVTSDLPKDVKERALTVMFTPAERRAAFPEVLGGDQQ